MKAHKILALDLDGTLLNTNLEITPASRDAIRKAIQAGIEVIISTGRPYDRIPSELAALGIRYAITANGAAVYRLPDKECLYADCFSPEEFWPLAQRLTSLDILFHVFVEGHCYSQHNQYLNIYKMDINEAQRNSLLAASTYVEDLLAFLKEKSAPVQKGTVNFYPLKDGTYRDRGTVFTYLSSNPKLHVVNGGHVNLEFTKLDVSKAKGLAFLAELLDVAIDKTIAIGDSENDLDIITVAGIGIAMGNASTHVKKAADLVTLSNDADGVAHAIQQLGILS